MPSLRHKPAVYYWYQVNLRVRRVEAGSGHYGMVGNEGNVGLRWLLTLVPLGIRSTSCQLCAATSNAGCRSAAAQQSAACKLGCTVAWETYCVHPKIVYVSDKLVFFCTFRTERLNKTVRMLLRVIFTRKCRVVADKKKQNNLPTFCVWFSGS